MISLSIIIPVFNQCSFTLSCLKDLFQLDEDTTEIIIVDNASTDNTQYELSKITRTNFRYTRNVQNLFHSAACNIGFQQSLGQNVLFLNNDIRVTSNYADWINAIIDNSDYLVGTTMGELDDNFNFIREANIEIAGNSYLAGWCIGSSRANFSKLAYSNNNQVWNEDLPFYFNDGDLSFRAKELQIPFKILPMPLAHFGKISANQMNIPKLYHDGKKAFSKLWINKIKSF